MSGEKIQAILDKSRDPPAIDSLALYLKRYVDVALYALEDKSYVIQLKLVNIGLRPNLKGCVHCIMTWPEYVRKFMLILRFVLCAARGDFPNDFSLPLMEVQGAFAQDLMMHLENAHDTDAQPAGLEQLKTNHEEKALMNCFSKDCHIMKSLHSLLWSLVSHKKLGCDPSKFYTPLYNYLVLSSYNAQGHLKVFYILKSRTFLISKYSLSSSHVSLLSCIVSTICLDNEGMPWINFVDKKFKSWVYHGKILSMQKLGDVMFKGIAEAMDLIWRKILCSIPSNDDALGFKRTGLVDSPQNMLLHYWFLQHQENNFEQYRDDLLQLWIGNEHTRKRFINTKAKDNKIEHVYAAYNCIQQILLAVTWFACSPPGHATEWQVLISMNSQQGHMRSLYIFTDESYLVTSYHKNFGATGKQKVTTKLVPTQVQELLLWSEVVLQPAMEYLLEVTHGAKAHMHMYDNIFPLASQTQWPNAINTAFPELMRKYLGIKLTVHNARATSAALEAFTLNIDAETCQQKLHKFHWSASDQQMHLPATEDRYYALTTSMLKHISAYQLQGYTYTSQVHQAALGFCSHPDVEEITDMAAPLMVHTVAVAVPTFESQKEIAQLVLNGVAGTLNESFAHTVTSILSRIPSVSKLKCTAEKQRVLPLTLRCVWDLLDNQDTLFHIPEQGVAVMKALAGTFNLQLILLTATAPTRIILALLKAAGRCNIHTICAPVTRPEIKYQYHYFNSKCKALKLIAAQYCKAHKSYKVRWTEVGPVIAATLALGYGVNVPHVRDVFFFGLPGNFLLAEKEAGRVGRNRMPANTWFIDVNDPAFFRHPPSTHNLLGDEDIIPALHPDDCLRLPFSQFFNDINVSCPELRNGQLCMNCKRNVLGPHPNLFSCEDASWGESVIHLYLPETSQIPGTRAMVNLGLRDLDKLRARQPVTCAPVPFPAAAPIPAPPSRPSIRALPSPPSTKHGNGQAVEPWLDSLYGMFFNDGDVDLYMNIDTEVLAQQFPHSDALRSYVTTAAPFPIHSSLAPQAFSDHVDANSSTYFLAPGSSVSHCLPVPLSMAALSVLYPQHQDDVFSNPSTAGHHFSAGPMPPARCPLPPSLPQSPTPVTDIQRKMCTVSFHATLSE
ncbi:hypothetical protein PUNSTDRAFT_42003 [Punctularia strigosozonata HHB-11173 SS5]|uniref:uncharacterized protein n=1 Tax=Punctularia strigosozonata (strain HHB-11173) TaxID=741275 RepID=UPI00044166D9|nr:uncharacterized protein PUNSTDRAFT_42003 [Punctularia strigosozonata HHB-11173 SS5]EIN12361.1 hypothetical protein PUNSTDRAFT_42003 [Punctularia strigosozonata HHB-11173 SS5]